MVLKIDDLSFYKNNLFSFIILNEILPIMLQDAAN
jgi:hypothetical protein